MEDIIEILKTLPNSQLDPQMVELIKKWDNPPQASQVLEVLDKCVFHSFTNGFYIKILDIILEDAFQRENTTFDAVAAKSEFRKQFGE